MNYIEIKKDKNTIKLYGNSSKIEHDKPIIENINLTGNERSDMLLLQKCIDDNKLKSSISYNGHTVYPFEKIVKEYRRLQKSDSLTNMSENMYHFFMYACRDIAHYDIQGFRGYYNNSLKNLERELLSSYIHLASWESDIDNIFKELKIGQYFKDRESINLDKLPIKTLKSIIKECGWNLTIDNNIWRLEKPSLYNTMATFEIDATSNHVSNIIKSIEYYSKEFDTNNYIENRVIQRGYTNDPLSIKEIVSVADNIKFMLSRLTNDLIYKSRITVDELDYKNRINNKNNEINHNEYDFDMCG